MHFTKEQVAASMGGDPEKLVKDATLRALDEHARFRSAVMEGKAYADCGEFVEEDEMDARFEEMLRS